MALLTVRLIHETDDAQECQQDFPRVGYHPTYRGDNEVYLCRSLRESRRSGPGLALLPFSRENQTAEPKKGTSCAVDLNYPIGCEAAESEPWGLVVCLIRLSHSNNEDSANKSCVMNYVCPILLLKAIFRWSDEETEDNSSTTDVRAAVFI
jgi:hypothetical protein